jgi:hypothetical protein
MVRQIFGEQVVKWKVLIIAFAVLMVSELALAQFRLPTAPPPVMPPDPSPRAAVDKMIAARFAPVIYQGLADQPRFDYITNFDFDGDWNGDNNWVNAGQKTAVLRAYVYYSVIETPTHYFVHYAFFHPRDYKGGLGKSTLVDALIKEGIRRAGKDPTGLADDVALSHENDLEGCLIVAEKRGDFLRQAVVQYVETMSHNRYLKYRSPAGQGTVGELIQMQEQQPLLFAEPKGHGVSNYLGTREQLKKSVNGTLVYHYTGEAADPEKRRGDSIGYDLIAMQETLWQRAQTGESETFAEVIDYQTMKISLQQLDGKAAVIEQSLGKMGAAFRGTIGFKNKARAPWGWYDSTEKNRPLGEWFFDPATVIARHFNLEQGFAQTYTAHPFFNLDNAPPAR